MRIKLPNELICCLPKAIQDPVRIGCANDGGYIIPQILLDHCDDLLSGGLGENWSFDRGWKARKPAAKIHMYDGTVSMDSMKDYLRAPYQDFFSSAATHYQENLGPGATSLTTAVQRLGSKRVLLKMDIEGGEFALLDEILAHRDIFPGIVIEIHFANHLRQNFINAVKKLQTQYTLVHLHGNNHTVLSQDGSCDCYEFTFLRYDLCTDFTNRPEFYLPGIDFSNVPGLDDWEFYFEDPDANKTSKPRQYDIAVLLPTHKRTDALRRSLFSLINLAQDLDRVQFRLGIDNNDTIGLDYFVNNIQPELDDRNINYEALSFVPMGYVGLNQYFNGLAKDADANWLFVWGDDAIMETPGWDQHIRKCTGEFKLLKVQAHNEHPYAVFPIYPREWIEILGYLSRHQMLDAESSQIAYWLDIMKTIDVHATHDRADLTGNNVDEAYKKREYLEGNPNNPRDLHHDFFVRSRDVDAHRLSNYMRSQNLNTEWWENILANKQDRWQRMKENDPNNQCALFQPTTDIDGQIRLVEYVPQNSDTVNYIYK